MYRPSHIPEALELAAMLRPEWAGMQARLRASGTPLNDDDNDGREAIMGRVRELNKDIATATQDAQAKHQTFEQLRSQLAGSDAVKDPASPEFQAAETASKDYSEAADRVSTMQETRERLLGMVSDRAIAVTDGSERKALQVADTLLEAVRRNAGVIASQSADYKRWVEAGAFTSSQRKSIEGVLIAGHGEEQREALKQALISGRGLQSALVTGLSDTSGGAFVQADRQPGYIGLRTRPLRMLDLITVGQTDSDTVSYVEMTGFTNNAAEVAEATATAGTSGTKPESALAMAVREITVKQIAHWIPATKRALADVGQLRTLIEGILQLGLDLRLDQQIVSGDGAGENIRGIRNTVGIGSINRVEAATGNTLTPESVLDALHRAITTVRLAFFEPTAIGIHPSDYEIVRLARSMKPAVANQAGTAGSYGEGDYLMGDPSTGDATRIWGLVPVVSAAFAQGHPVVGDFRQAVLWLRDGTSILASDSHMDFFIRNMVAILAEFRAAFGVIAPPAFCEIDIT